MKRLAQLLVIASVALVPAGCGGDDDDDASPRSSGGSPASTRSVVGGAANAIEIRDFSFSPRTATVERGGRVRVSNDDSTAHTVTADDGHSFDTGTVDSGASRTISVTKAGSYPYHCSIHNFMHGKLVVR